MKRYAVSFCGTKELREASREQVERFVDHIAQVAREGRNHLAELLAPYAAAPQGKPPVSNNRDEHADRDKEAA